MPHEKINFISDVFPEDMTSLNQLIVGWNAAGWVQVSVAPFGWKDTGDWSITDMSRRDVDRLIRVLKKARRVAYPE